MEPRHVADDSFKAVGESEAFLSLQERISGAAKTDRPVIFIGERGVGKELAAKRLHLLSQRWNQPYVTLNCASLSPTLIESELFGHEAGAFTGAVRLRKGRFGLAHGGSLFLDEIGIIPMTAQEKILRVVEYGQMERVGSSSTQAVNVRLIAATNSDLRHEARQGRFRQDLLDRLSFEVITLPPLRSRGGDIMLLANYFVKGMAAEMGLAFVPLFSGNAEKMLREHGWPGNIRELKNVIERMVYRSPAEVIDEILFDPFDSPFALEAAGEPSGKKNAQIADQKPRYADGAETEGLDSLPLPEAVHQYVIHRLQQALKTSRFNQRKAADLLGLTYDQFRGYYRKYKDSL